jgi:membrane protein DedA with SNARE-associated domain
MGPFRATVPLVAGMSELEFWPFMIANSASALIWAYVLLAPGAAILRHIFP